MSEKMEQRLSSDVSKMRNQVMSFTNEGAEFQLNVPDTNEVKENFAHLVTVSVQQQKQITMLQTSMQDMAEDHMKSQEAIIAWATECITGLKAQNERLEKIVSDQRTEISNITYNLQGYENDSFAFPKNHEFSLEAPGLYKTKTPKVIHDCAEIADEEHGLFFHTSTGAEVELSSIDFNPESRKGGPIKLIVPIPEEVPEKSAKTQAQKDQARYKYQSTKPYSLPSGATKRWQWAIRKVIRNNRLEKHKVGLNRGKLPKNDTLAAKLARMDYSIYEIPVHLRKHVAEREAAINARVDSEVEVLNSSLETQKKEYTAMGESLQGNIDATNVRVDDVDARLVKLQEQVDNGNKQLDEIELKLGKVIARVNTEESVLFDSMKARIQEANEKIVSLKAGAGSLTGVMEKLNEMNEAMVEGIEYETDAERMDAEAKKLFEMLRFETEVRSARNEISLLDNNAFALHEMLRFVRREILALSVLAGGDYEAIIPKETINELLALVDSGLTTIDSVNDVITSANSLWKVHDTVLSHRWNILAGVVEAVKNVSNIANDIVQIRETMASLPTEEKVKEIGNEIVINALEPVSESIEEVDKKALKANDETNNRVTEVDEAWKKGIAQLDKDMRDTFDAIQVQRAEMQLGGGDSKPTSRAGNMDLETQLEPMIKDIVEMYVQHPPSRSKVNAAESKVSDFFALEAVPAGYEDGEEGMQQSPLFAPAELELVFNRASEQDASEMSDDITDIPAEGLNGGNPQSEDGISVGCLVRVVNKDSRFYDHSGIITAVVEAEDQECGSAEEKDGEMTQPENDDGAATTPEPRAAVDSTKMRYRVAMTPKTPKNIEGAELEGGFRTFDTYDGSKMNEESFGPPASAGAGMDEMRRQMTALSKKVEEIMKGISEGSLHAGGEVKEGINRGGGGEDGSEAAPRAMSPGFGRTSPNGSPINSLRKSPSFGQSDLRGAAGTSNSMLDTSSMMDLIQDSLRHVTDEIGDLRQTNARELQKAKEAMKKAIMTAINKAIQEEAEKDKPAMLSTRSLCVGCGRPSLVRGTPYEQDLVSKAFNPSLNAKVQAGPDIYRAGFRMPVNKNNSVAKLNGTVPGGPKVFSEDSLFGGVEEQESMTGTLNTYSEIIANLDHRNNAQITNLQDAGPAGMSISITSTTAPIRQLSYPARNIRHAQGKEDAAMLRPIHRKGFPGKTSERARSGANKTWVPERFDDPSSLGLSPKAVSIPRPKPQQQLQQSAALMENSVASSQFQP